MIWAIAVCALGLAALTYEALAIIDNSDDSLTISQWLWRVVGESLVLRALVGLFLLWLLLHITFGPCAFGIC